MWIHLPNGRTELVLNEDHIKRLLSEGGREVPDPRVPAKVEETEPEQQPEAEAVVGDQPNEDSTPATTKPKTTKRGK